MYTNNYVKSHKASERSGPLFKPLARCRSFFRRSEFQKVAGIASLFVLLTMLSASSYAQVFPSIQWDKTFGGGVADQNASIIEVNGGGYLFAATSASGVSGNKTTANKGGTDIWVVRTDASGNKLWEKSYGSGWNEGSREVIQTADGGFVIVGIITKTAGTNPNTGDVTEPDHTSAADTDTWVIKLDANGDKIWDRRLGSSVGSESSRDIIQTPDGGYMVSASINGALPGRDVSEPGRGGFDYWLVKLDASGNKLWDRRYGGSSTDSAPDVVIDHDGGYLLAGTSFSNAGYDKSESIKGGSDIWVVKVDQNGNKIWDKTIGSPGTDGNARIYPTDDGDYIITGQSDGDPGFDRTAPKKASVIDYWVVKLDANRNVVWDKAYGGNSSSNNYAASAPASDGGYYLIGNVNDTAVAGDKADPGGTAGWIIKINSEGVKVWDKSLDDTSPSVIGRSYRIIETSDGGALVSAFTSANSGADKTQNGFGLDDIWLIKLGCGYVTETVINDLSPANQDACINGTPQVITGTDDDAIYPDKITYQWQRSINGTDGWTDIADATLRNYLPEPSASTMYYRRIASWECHEDISNVAVVNINGNTAPTLSMGGPYYTCTSQPVTLGNNPIVSGGSSPYTYLWDNASFLSGATAAHPNATVSTTSVFTLTVTDVNGCKKVGQALVNVPPAAFAGPDVSFCPGTSGVQIGTEPIVGLSGVTYSWTLVGGGPAPGLSSTSVAQPIASPAATTTYRLTVSYTNSNGLVCNVTDDVTVTVASAPTAGFAGPDRTICSGGTSVLGLTTQAGYTYTWSPGLYLETNNTAQVTFNPGTPFPMAVDPITYSVTATSGSCTYTDQVVVTVIKADAGIDACGPRMVGTVDLTPNVNETYSWTRLASSTGSGNFTGATNLPFVPVSGTSTGVDTYQVTVSHGGTNCVNTVDVPPCGDCIVNFEAIGGNCLVYNGKPLKLIADNGGQTGYTYTWSPATGLSSATGPVVYLLDGVNRNYTLTKTYTSSPTITCSVTKEVNPPAVSYPIFTAADITACDGAVVNIGAPPVAGYTYSWTGPGSFTSGSSNPSITVSSSTIGSYAIRVDDTDPTNTGGCFVLDTITVSRETVVAPQTNWTVCANAIVKLGAPDPSGGTWTYSWSPAIASYQNGTGPTSAEPEVLVTTNTAFTVTVTNPAGCTATSTSNITVTSNPTIANAPNITNACPGSTQMIGSPALPGVTYVWTPSAGLSNPNIAQPTVTVGAGGSSVTYTVVATFPGTCASTATDAVAVSAFNADFTMPNISYCPTSTVNIGASAPSTGVATYSWSPEIGLSNSRIRNPTTNVKTTTVYTLTVTYTNGCIGTGTVTVTPTSSVDAGADRTVCFGASTTIGNPYNNGTPTWIRVGGGTTYLSSTSGKTVVFNSAGTAPAGTYTFRASQTVSSCTVTDDVVVIVSAATTLPSGGVTICLNGTGTMGVAAVAGFTYTWAPATGLSSPGASMTNVTMAAAGTYNYTLYATNSVTGCTSSAPYIVTVLPGGAPVVTVPDVNACIGSPFTLTPTVSPSGGSYSYVWNPATGLSNQFVATPTATVNETRTYTLEVTDNTTGCSGSGSGTVTVSTPGTSFITVGPASSTACSGTAVALSATSAAGYDFAYQWQKYNSATSTWENMTNGGLYSGVTTTTLNISDNTTLNGAQFRLEVTLNSCGNKQESSIATLTVNQCLKSSLGDKVWDDTNRDGIQDAGEPGVAGVTVMLYRNGAVVGTTTSGTDGYYIFDNLDARDPFGNPYSYQVSFANLPPNYVFTSQGATAGSNGAGTTTDSDVNPSTGMSRPVTLTYGQNIPDVDAGIHSTAPLPVTLVRFNAVSENNTALLTWSTSAETNSSVFDIQRSQNAIEWMKIDEVMALGKSNSMHQYQYVDPQPLNGINYYRLKMIDRDGTFALSRVLSVHFESLENVTLFPNPVSDVLKINNTQNLAIQSVEIVDVSGKTVYLNKNQSDLLNAASKGIDIHNLADGIYIVKVTDANGVFKTSKIVVSH